MKDTRKRPINEWVITIGTIIFALLIGLLAWRQLYKYEMGVLDVYAVQQDGYVQLVLDQINLTDERDSEEIVHNILGTLDASSNRYWTMSQSDALIFVKDVLETNRYKGFSTATYYGSDSAKEFIAGLQTNRVTHMTIAVEDRYFIASGVEFEYRGEKYRICLLTNSDVVLDQNAYLSAKITICVLALLLLAAFVLFGLYLSRQAQKWYRAYTQSVDREKALLKNIEKLNEELSRDTFYDTRLMSFQEIALPIVMEKLEKRDVWPLEFFYVSCRSREDRDSFLVRSQSVMDRKVLRFSLTDTHILFVAIACTEYALQKAMDAIDDPGVTLKAKYSVKHKPESSLQEMQKEFWEQVQKNDR